LGNQPMKAAATAPRTATIRQLVITRFRGIKSLKWNPAEGLNVILGGGDVGKTTILEAIALLLSPTNNVAISESDYLNRDTGLGFAIQAVVSLPSSSEISQKQKFAWPWEWNGTDAVLPALKGDDDLDDIPAPKCPVYRLQVHGTPEMELTWEVLQPNDQTDPLSTAIRRNIGVVRLGGDDRNDRDLRLVYGSALDRLLADQGLRARIAQQISEIDLNANLGEDAKKSLAALDQTFATNSLPSGLELGLTSSQGISIGALIGLLAEKEKDLPLPLSSWGAGTRRLATLNIAAATQAKTRIAVIDEVERGFEPYRVRKLIKTLQGEPTQSFVTTHSPVAIGAAQEACLWYLDATGAIGALSHTKIEEQQKRDPETFLSRLAVIAEGPTEVGFTTYLLSRVITGELLDYGIRVCDGQGTPATLGLLEAMCEARLKIAAFVDCGDDQPGRWKAVKEKMGNLLFQWDSGCTEERIIALVPADTLLELIKNPDGNVEAERRKTLADRLGIQDASIEAIQKTATDLRALIVAASTGSKAGAPNADCEKTWKKHGARWFKSVPGGRELAQKMIELGLWSQLSPTLMPFANAVQSFVGQAQTTGLIDE